MNKQQPNLTPEMYGKVAVLYGGVSAEREISIETGSAVHAALIQTGIDAHLLDTKSYSVLDLPGDGFERAFIALHGRGGEDGVIQGALESINIPYTGSRVLGSALAMDKVRCKWIWSAQGLSTPAFMETSRPEDLNEVINSLTFPLMVKPVNEGSSCGISRVESAASLEPAWIKASRLDDRVMCEEWIGGAEYTIGLLQGQALPAIKLQTRRDFYNYEAKYLDEDTAYLCPCGLTQQQETDLAGLALQAFQLVNASGWGRVDLMLAEDGTPFLIEVNTIPGMTSHSLVPLAARQAGIDFNDLVLRILKTSLINEADNAKPREKAL